MKKATIYLAVIGIAVCFIVASLAKSTLTLGATIDPPTPTTDENFGLAIEFMDCDDDGELEVVILQNIYCYVYNITDIDNPSYIPREIGPFNQRPYRIAGETLSGLWDIAVGDFNGDGWDDIVLSDYEFSTMNVQERGRIWIFYSDITNQVSLSNPFHIDGTSAGDNFGFSIEAGDFDGDGYDDLIVSSPGAVIPPPSGGRGEVYIYWGSDDFDDPLSGWRGTASPMTIQPDIPSGFDEIGWCVRNVGDLDDDRDDEEEIQYYDDFVITNKNQEVYCTSYDIAVFYGNSRNSINSTPDVQIITGNRYFGADVDSGDINGDGYSDIVTGYLVDVRGNRVNVGTVVVIYPGSSNGVSSNNGYSKLAESTPFSDDPPYDVACMGDEDNDGYDDILMSRPYYNDSGIVYCWNGVSNLSNIDYSSWNLTGNPPQTDQLFGYYRECAGKAICGIPDTDDDMCYEVFIGSPYWDGNSTTDSGMVEYYK